MIRGGSFTNIYNYYLRMHRMKIAKSGSLLLQMELSKGLLENVLLRSEKNYLGRFYESGIAYVFKLG